MIRDILVKEYEKDTGNKFNVECVVYNDYAEWLEHTVISEREIAIEAKNRAETKQLNIAVVSKQRELFIAFGEKVVSDRFKSDKPRTVEDSYEEFISNL